MDLSGPVSPAEAADALHDIAQAQEHSQRLYGYQLASPHLIMWGVIWVIGYATSFSPAAGWIWTGLVCAGSAGSFWMGTHQHARVRRGFGWRYLAGSVAVVAFLCGLFAILQPPTALQTAAVMPLLVAVAYTLDGIFRSGARMWITGIGIGVLTVAGALWLPQYFLVWMAVAGGGGLILGGVWLRSA
ncbi:MAG: hypothetical protein ACRD1Y_03395 [Terriglobales bacterium]